jgi:hypothetical protein
MTGVYYALAQADTSGEFPTFMPNLRLGEFVASSPSRRTTPSANRWSRNSGHACLPRGSARPRDSRRTSATRPIGSRSSGMVRLHSAIGYVKPPDMLAGRQAELRAARDRKVEQARRQRQLRRQQATPSRFARSGSVGTMTSPRGNGSGLCGDATMLRDNLAGLISRRWHRAAPESSDDRPPMPQTIPAPKGRNLSTNGEHRFSISR